jgi:tRNA-splicing ligase RtcB (3'-phosphate/5'-hydroxy nucleic acid ligase)
MSELAPLNAWLFEPMPADVGRMIDRLRRSDDVRRLAVMPDVHLAKDVCVGTVVATRRLLYPGAVGGDIGCGMLALPLDATADALTPANAARVLLALRGAVPPMRRHRRRTVAYPDDLAGIGLSHPALAAVSRDEGVLQLGTLGGGNHFVELQADEEHRLWLMVHSGSRAMGQAIRAHHCAHACVTATKLLTLDADTEHGRAYLNDVHWARRYADANRRAMADAVVDVLREVLDLRPATHDPVTCDHNHVAMESHDDEPLLVHRKGAMPADEGVAGLLPGSMGTTSYHVEGRGHPLALRSSAHGAGRSHSRERARRRITGRALLQQMQGVFFDFRQTAQLREEAPAAYKDIKAVLRAQHELVKVTRTLRPLLVYKAS